MPKYLPSANSGEGEIAQQLSAKMRQFPVIFSEMLNFVLLYLKK
jgi:hypothetical protein